MLKPANRAAIVQELTEAQPTWSVDEVQAFVDNYLLGLNERDEPVWEAEDAAAQAAGCDYAGAMETPARWKAPDGCYWYDCTHRGSGWVRELGTGPDNGLYWSDTRPEGAILWEGPIRYGCNFAAYEDDEPPAYIKGWVDRETGEVIGWV
jgi:hypothetical protein